MRQRISEWMENMCREDYEPAWQEPLEWISIGFTIAVIFFNLAM